MVLLIVWSINWHMMMVGDSFICRYFEYGEHSNVQTSELIFLFDQCLCFQVFGMPSFCLKSVYVFLSTLVKSSWKEMINSCWVIFVVGWLWLLVFTVSIILLVWCSGHVHLCCRLALNDMWNFSNCKANDSRI